MISDLAEWTAGIFIFILFVCLTPVLVPLYLLVIVYRTLVALEIKRRYSHQGPSDYPCGHLLDFNDVKAYYGNNHGKNIVSSFVVFDGYPEKERVKNEMLNLLINKIGPDGKIRFPRFQMIPEIFLGVSFWNYDPHFDIDNHVKFYDKELVGLEKCRSVIEEITNEPLHPGKRCPGWEIIIIPFKNEDSDTVRKGFQITRFHHAYGDGVAIFRVLMESLFINEKVKQKMLEAVTKQQQLMQGMKMSLFKRTMYVMKAVLFMPYFSISLFLRSDNEHALHRKDMAKHCKMSWTDYFPLETLRSIKAATNCSINDIFLSCVIGALRHYYEKNNLELPKKITCAIPISTEILFEPPQLQNQTGFFMVGLPVDIADPLKRLKTINSIMNKKKESPDYLLSIFLARVVHVFPNFVIKKITTDAVDMTLFASNLPGPNYTPEIFGVKVTKFIGFVPIIMTAGLGVALNSFNGQVLLTVTVDKNLEPDQQRINDIAQYFMDEINRLLSMQQ